MQGHSGFWVSNNSKQQSITGQSKFMYRAHGILNTLQWDNGECLES